MSGAGTPGRTAAPTDHTGLADHQAAPLAVAEWVLVVGVTATVAVGCTALILAYFSALSRANLLLALAGWLTLVAAYVARRWRDGAAASRDSAIGHAIRHAGWHAAALTEVLIIAAYLYTPPADYAPAFLDAGWYTNTAALIARTGGLEAQPAALQELPPEERRLFIRTYSDFRRSIPSFPDRADLGFVDQVFAVDLTGSGSVGPYHPPFLAAALAAARLVSSPGLAQYLPAIFGLLFVLAVYAASRTIFNAAVGLLAAALVALSPAVIYYARTPFAEILLGACVWSGTWALSRYAAASRSHASPALPGVAGLALGASLLVKLEAFLLLIPVGLFWLVWCARGRATRRQVASFAVPFGALLGLSLLLAGTVTRPYTILNGYGVWQLVTRAMHSPIAFFVLPAASALAVGLLAGLASPAFAAAGRPTLYGVVPRIAGRQALAGRLRPAAAVREALGLIPLAGAGALLLVAWFAARGAASATWSSLVALVLFATPLGAALALVGLSRLVVRGFERRMLFPALLCATVGGATLLVPAVSTNLSPLYTVRRLVPVVVPCVAMLAAYAIHSGFLAVRARAIGRSAAIVAVALLVFTYVDAARPLIAERELAGSSAFVDQLAERFDPTAVVLFESVDRGSHVGRFAAPLWAEHQVAALQLGTSRPPQAETASAIAHWQAAGRQVYYVTQGPPPPPDDGAWRLIAREEWAGRSVAATAAFPPETWILPITFNIYESR